MSSYLGKAPNVFAKVFTPRGMMQSIPETDELSSYSSTRKPNQDGFCRVTNCLPRLIIPSHQTNGRNDDEVFESPPETPVIEDHLIYHSDLSLNYTWADDDHVTYLMMASSEGNMRDVNKLLQLGFDVDETDSEGRTALMYASYTGQSDVVTSLIENGAGVLTSDVTGKTALMWASWSGQISACRQLLGSASTAGFSYCSETAEFIKDGTIKSTNGVGVGVNTPDRDGMTPLMFALVAGHFPVVSLLVECGANVNAADCRGLTPLMLSCIAGRGEILQFLLTNGARLNRYDRENTSALVWAFLAGHKHLFNYLYTNHVCSKIPDDLNFWTKRDSENCIPQVVSLEKRATEKVTFYKALRRARRWGYEEMYYFLLQMEYEDFLYQQNMNSNVM